MKPRHEDPHRRPDPEAEGMPAVIVVDLFRPVEGPTVEGSVSGS